MVYFMDDSMRGKGLILRPTDTWPTKGCKCLICVKILYLMPVEPEVVRRLVPGLLTPNRTVMVVDER